MNAIGVIWCSKGKRASCHFQRKFIFPQMFARVSWNAALYLFCFLSWPYWSKMRFRCQTGVSPSVLRSLIFNKRICRAALDHEEISKLLVWAIFSVKSTICQLYIIQKWFEVNKGVGFFFSFGSLLPQHCQVYMSGYFGLTELESSAHVLRETSLVFKYDWIRATHLKMLYYFSI